MNSPVINPNSHLPINVLNTPHQPPHSSAESGADDLQLNANMTLLKDLARVVFADNDGKKLINLQQVIRSHVEPDSRQVFYDSSSEIAHRQLSQLYSLPPVNDVEEMIAHQKNTVKLTADVIEHTDNELHNQALQTKKSEAQLSARVKRADSDAAERGEITTGTSYAQLWARLALAIAGIKTDYVDFYADLMLKYTKMYESFNENVQKASSEAISTGDDGNNVKFDKNKMQVGYDTFERDVEKFNKTLGSIKNWDTMSEEAKNSLTITLQPAFKVNQKGEISFNLDQYSTIKGSHPSGIDKNGKVSTASYQAWLATFNAAGNTFQSNMQSFAQRYSQANSTFDNINKVLSGSISSLAESAKDVLKSL